MQKKIVGIFVVTLMITTALPIISGSSYINTSPPTVSLTAPEPGLYLFGIKLLPTSKIIIIGAFIVEATASDAESGIYRLQFYLDGELFAEDTEPPFSVYCAIKHMGAGIIKVVAEDFVHNAAEDTLEITYYNFL